MTIAQLVETSKKIPGVKRSTLKLFVDKLDLPPYTREEGATEHYTAYLIPFHKPTHSLFAGSHKKSGFWIPPGGHIDRGETPVETAVREFNEELSYKIAVDMAVFFNISSSIDISNREECTRHLEFWFKIDLPEKINFKFDRGEFYEAQWFTIAEFLKKETYRAMKDGVRLL